MLDLLLIVAGLSLVGGGIWMIYPPLALIVFGLALMAIAYGRYRTSETDGENKKALAES